MTKVYSDGDWFTGFVSRVLVPEGRQHCTQCRGTGLFMMNDIVESNIKEYQFK